MSKNEPTTATPLERFLAFAAITIAVIALISLFVLFGAPLLGVEFGNPPAWYWDALLGAAYYGFVVAFLFVVALIVVRMRANRRANRD